VPRPARFSKTKKITTAENRGRDRDRRIFLQRTTPRRKTRPDGHGVFRDEPPPPPRHPRFAGAVATAECSKIKQRNRTDDADTDGCHVVLNVSVSSNAINTHHFEMFLDEICSEKSNCVARVSGADVATERMVRGTVRRTVGLRYTALTPPPQNTSGRHDTLHRAADHGNNGYDTPPSLLAVPSIRVRTRCVRVANMVANLLVSRKIKRKTYYFYYSHGYSLSDARTTD